MSLGTFLKQTVTLVIEREILAQNDPFFDTRTGEACMRSVAQAFSDPRRGHVDRIEQMTPALERIAGISARPL